MSFWDQLSKPFFVLAPMADVTDVAFRTLIAECGGPDVMWTEFVSADGLAMAPEEGRRKLLKDLEYTEGERPIVAQLFSATPEHMREGAKLCKELGFDGVDINMGCPDRSVEKQGCGAAMIKNPDVARAVIEAAKEGAGGLPVSVKTRLGYNRDELEEWLPVLLSCKLPAITIHARTRKEMSKVPARWERVARAVEIRNEFEKGKDHHTLIIGNGDALSVGDARAKARASGADGVMLGRAIFGNPYLFSTREEEVTTEERLKMLVRHTNLFVELLPHKNFAIMKKHFKAYVTGFPEAKELRMKLMETKNAKEVETIIHDVLNTYFISS